MRVVGKRAKRVRDMTVAKSGMYDDIKTLVNFRCIFKILVPRPMLFKLF